MKIKKVDDKPMIIHTKEKAKIHAHEPKEAKIKGSNIYTVERGPKTIGVKISDGKKKSYRKSTIHQSESKNKGISRFKRNYRESNTSIKTKNTNLFDQNGQVSIGTIHTRDENIDFLEKKIEQYQNDLDASKAEYDKPFAYSEELNEKLARQCELNAQLDLENAKAVDSDLRGPEEEREADDRMEAAAIVAEDKGAYPADREGRTR